MSMVSSHVDCASHVVENYSLCNSDASCLASSSRIISYNCNNKRKHDHDDNYLDQPQQQQHSPPQQQTKIQRLDHRDKDRVSPRILATTKKGVVSLTTLCQDALLKYIDLIDERSLEVLSDEWGQSLVAHHHHSKTLSGKLISLVRHCPLSRLDLSGKDIPMDDSWLSFGNAAICNTLVSVNFSKNTHISDDGLAQLACLTRLTSLDISHCDSLLGTGLIRMIERYTLDPGHMHQYHPLQKLNLQGCSKIDVSSCLQSLSHCQQLDSLDISSLRLLDEHLAALTGLASLRQLDLSDNADLTSAALKHIGRLDRLLHLNISGCPAISHEGYQSLPLTLQTLEASNCNIGDQAMEHIGALSELNNLSLINNPFTDHGAAHLSKLVSLTALDLSMCTLLTDQALEHLKSLTQISKLNLNFNSNLTDTGVAMLTGGLCDLTSLGIIGCDRLLIKVKRKPLVLLVEDNAIQVTLITKTMERYNFAVEVASNGQMALEMYKANPKYELILMDIVMPIMDGLTATMMIRDYEREHGLKRTPLIMQTGNTEAGHRKVCLQAGCDDFMLKPLDKQVVYRAKELFKKDSQQQLLQQQQQQQQTGCMDGHNGRLQGASDSSGVADSTLTPCLNFNQLAAATASMSS